MSMLFKRFKDWATAITAFRTGDVIPVDGPSGTAKMSKDDLLRVTADAETDNLRQLNFFYDIGENNDGNSYTAYCPTIKGRTYIVHNRSTTDPASFHTSTDGTAEGYVDGKNLFAGEIYKFVSSANTNYIRGINSHDLVFYSVDVAQELFTDLDEGVAVDVRSRDGFLDPSMFESGYLRNTGEVNANAGFLTSPMYAVDAVKGCGIYNLSIFSSGVCTNAFYDADGVFIKNVNKSYSLKIDDNLIATEGLSSAKYVRFTIPSDTKVCILPLRQGDFTFVIPPRMYSVVNHYLRLVLNNSNYDGSIEKDSRLFTDLDTSSSEGHINYRKTSTMNLSWFNFVIAPNTRLKMTEQRRVRVFSESAGTGANKNVMIFGESTTDNSYILPAVMTLFSADGLNITLVGTRKKGNYYCEGRSGWSTDDYLTKAQIDDRVNAFFDPVSQTFSYPYYKATSGVADPDCIIINEGINDVIASGYDEDTTIANLNTIINSMRTALPNVPIVITLFNLCSGWPDLKTSYQGDVRNKMLSLIERYIKEWGDREGEHFYLCPVYLALDTKWDMQYTQVQRDTIDTTLIYKGTDAWHPSEQGYKKMSECYYNIIKTIAALNSWT